MLGNIDRVATYPGETSEERMEFIRRDIRESATIPDELKEPIVKRFYNNSRILEQKIMTQPGARYQTGQLGASHWVIRNDNLKLVEILAAAALAIAGFASVAAASPVVMAVSLLSGVVALANRLKKKGASLTEEQYKILVNLKGLKAANSEELATRLSGLHIFGPEVWTVDRTEKALQDLKSKRLGDGSIEALVSQAADNLWSTNGL